MDNRNNHRTSVVTGAYTNPLRAKLCKGESRTYIQDKIKTKVVVAKIDIGFPKNNIRSLL
jgi:hypothetical protein